MSPCKQFKHFKPKFRYRDLKTEAIHPKIILFTRIHGGMKNLSNFEHCRSIKGSPRRQQYQKCLESHSKHFKPKFRYREMKTEAIDPKSTLFTRTHCTMNI